MRRAARQEESATRASLQVTGRQEEVDAFMDGRRGRHGQSRTEKGILCRDLKRTSTQQKAHSKPAPEVTEPSVHLTTESLETLAAQLRESGYRSGLKYLLEAKKMHISAGHEWSAQLEQTLRDCRRGIERGNRSGEESCRTEATRHSPPPRREMGRRRGASERPSESKEMLAGGSVLGIPGNRGRQHTDSRHRPGGPKGYYQPANEQDRPASTGLQEDLALLLQHRRVPRRGHERARCLCTMRSQAPTHREVPRGCHGRRSPLLRPAREPSGEEGDGVLLAAAGPQRRKTQRPRHHCWTQRSTERGQDTLQMRMATVESAISCQMGLTGCERLHRGGLRGTRSTLENRGVREALSRSSPGARESEAGLSVGPRQPEGPAGESQDMREDA